MTAPVSGYLPPSSRGDRSGDGSTGSGPGVLSTPHTAPLEAITIAFDVTGARPIGRAGP